MPVHLHPEMFALRAIKGKDGKPQPMEPIAGVAVLSGSGGDPLVTRDEQSVLGDAFFISGEIPRSTPFEHGIPGQVRQRPDGSWEPDEILPDERFVAVHVAGKGLVVFTACSHAGLINVLLHARRGFRMCRFMAWWGRVPSLRADRADHSRHGRGIGAVRPELIAAGHCTGWRAINALANAYGSAVVPSAVGKIYRL